MQLPVKLVDLGGGVGQLREFSPSDTIPLSALPSELLALTDVNPIINGAMQVATVAGPFTAIASGAYSLDMWQTIISGSSAVITMSQEVDAPSSGEFGNSLRATVTTADTAIGASEVCEIKQQIEGYNARRLIGKTFTLGFWVRSSKTGVHCVNFANQSGSIDRSYITEYTVNAINTWEYKTVTVVDGLPLAGAWNWTDGSGLQVRFVLAAGSTRRSTANTWLTGNFDATNNQVNCLDSVGNIFAITGVSINLGSSAKPFPHRLIQQEKFLAARYYERLFVNLYNNNGTSRLVNGLNLVSVAWRVEKRAIPSLTLTPVGLTNVWSATIGFPGILGARVLVTQDAAGGMEYMGNITIDARLA